MSRVYFHNPLEDEPWSDDAYTAALKADATARAVRGALAELDELEAWWELPAAGERAPG